MAGIDVQDGRIYFENAKRAHSQSVYPIAKCRMPIVYLKSLFNKDFWGVIGSGRSGRCSPLMIASGILVTIAFANSFPTISDAL